MKKIIILAFILSSTFSINVFAGQATNDLGNCMIRSLSQQEKQNLAKWSFFAIAAHPEIAKYSNISDSDREDTDKFFGHLITRLMTEDCPKEASTAFEEDGSSSYDQAFGLVGDVAWQELMSSPDVANSLSGFEKYLDQDKFDELFNQ